MEIKKAPHADLQKKRVIFLETGMIFSLLVVILAFSWSKKEKEEPVFVISLGGSGPMQEMMPVTREPPQGSPKPQQKVQQNVDIIRVVLNDTEIETEIDFNDFDEDAIFVESTGISGPGVADGVPGGSVGWGDDDIFENVEDAPTFLGKSLDTFQPWVQQRVKYPNDAKRQNIQGRVMVEFVIEKDGSLSNIEVLGNPNPLLANEAIRVIKTSPAWGPGKQRGRAVRVRFRIPVVFQLI